MPTDGGTPSDGREQQRRIFGMPIPGRDDAVDRRFLGFPVRHDPAEAFARALLKPIEWIRALRDRSS